MCKLSDYGKYYGALCYRIVDYGLLSTVQYLLQVIGTIFTDSTCTVQIQSDELLLSPFN